MNTPTTQTPVAAPTGSAPPSRGALQIVQAFLWISHDRETVGSPWPDEYIRDAARMVDLALLAESSNTDRSGSDR